VRVYFCNDTSKYHAGSAAVCHFIREQLARRGHVVVEESLAEPFLPIRDCEAVLVNGEGTFHHNSKRAQGLLRILEKAQQMGKATFIVNTLWQAMDRSWRHVLRRLDGFIVREVLSRQEVERDAGIVPTVRLDFSYWAMPAPPGNDCPKQMRATDFYSKEFGCFVRPMGGWLSRIPFLDMKNMDWKGLFENLENTSLLVTGRHHGVYAAAKAKVPFVAMSGNTHKIEGLIRWSGIDIPLANSPAELRSLVQEVEKTRPPYEALFEWMDSQPMWRGIP